MGEVVCLLTEAEHEGPHNPECPRYARPTAPSSAGSVGDVEALAAAACVEAGLSPRWCETLAPILSRGLAAHTARALADDRERLASDYEFGACACGRGILRHVDAGARSLPGERGWWHVNGRIAHDHRAALAAPHVAMPEEADRG